MITLNKNGRPLDLTTCDDMFTGKNIMISIDSSKSNSAIVVSDLNKNILCDFEFSGEGKDVDVYDLCLFTRRYMKRIFNGSIVRKVGIENIITKQEPNYHGLDIHYSRAAITAVFNNFIFYFQDNHNIMPELINNNTWKVAVLPQEFRKRKYDKGSLEWFKSSGSPYGKRKDDVTDALCIMMYLWQTSKLMPIKEVTNLIPFNGEYMASIYPISDFTNYKVTQFNISVEEWDFQKVVNTVAASLKNKEVGFFECYTRDIPLDFIYRFSNNKVIYMGAEKVAVFVELRGDR